MQIFVSCKGFVAVYSMKNELNFKDALYSFCKKVGITIAVDPSADQTFKAVRRLCIQAGTTIFILGKST